MKRPWVLAVLGFISPVSGQAVPVDLGGYSPECGVLVRREGDRLTAAWPMEKGEQGRLALDLRPGQPPLLTLGIASSAGAAGEPLLSETEPEFGLTVGIRSAPGGRPPDMSVWNVFFDNPAGRPHETHRSRFELKEGRVTSAGKRATIALGVLTIGPFSGEMHFTLYPGSRLVHLEAVVTTGEDLRAITYRAGLQGSPRRIRQFAWMDTEGRLQGARADQLPVGAAGSARAVRHRTVIAECEGGSVASFPPPHQFFFPRDLSDNLKTVWISKWNGSAPSGERLGFGIDQPAWGGGGFVPWFNAPPGTRQRLGLFLLLARGDARAALDEALRYTRGDRFAPLPGMITFTSHYHMAVAVTALGMAKEGRVPLPVPDLVRVFKDMGVQAVHLAEFHGDGHPRDPGPLRLPELESMFSECRRLSDGELLLIPGEEINDYLGIKEPGKHPGHWMSLFPRPVRWTQVRSPDQPQEEKGPQGSLYRVGSREDMVRLLEKEGGLAWAAHPRIKASSWTPDIFRKEDFYLADFWLGGAWKAMPADLSRERLGERCLDLLDDMANWGQKKYLPGEVDVFKIDRTHELYGHMNVNYLRLDRLPRYEEGWRPIMDALRRGRFFVTTGEVLIREFTVGGKESGETLVQSGGAPPEVQVSLEWTFPLRFAEVISGDGEKVYRERIDLANTGPFGSRALSLKPELRGRKWARFEAWDIAVNGAFTQPVWLAAGVE